MTRRLAREIAMKTLFACDLGDHEPDYMFHYFCQGNEISDKANSFSQQLIQGVWEQQVFLDGVIKDYALAWDLTRMASVDRNIIRMALYEMIFLEDIPPVVTINEALEIAKNYSTKASPRFINGILDQVLRQLIHWKKKAQQKK